MNKSPRKNVGLIIGITVVHRNSYNKIYGRYGTVLLIQLYLNTGTKSIEQKDISNTLLYLTTNVQISLTEERLDPAFGHRPLAANGRVD